MIGSLDVATGRNRISCFCCLCVQVIFGALHVSDHLSYLEVDYTKAYLQCLVSEERRNGNAAAVVEPAVGAASTAKVA